MINHFAYGSNMDPARIKKRIGRAPVARPASLRGYELRFNKQVQCKPGIGYANIVEAADKTVCGVLYDLTKEELDSIDKCEGVHSGHYLPANVQVEIENGQPISAVTYIACADRVAAGLLPERCYLDHLLAGREYLPPEYLERLKKQVVRKCQRM